MKIVDSAVAYIRARPAIVVLTACAFVFFFAVMYFALAMILPFDYRAMAAVVAVIASIGITFSIVKRHLNDD